MPLPTTWGRPGTSEAGESYVNAHLQQWDYFFRRGTVRIPDDNTGKLYPVLSNGELVALAQAWRNATRAGGGTSHRASWPAWYDLMLAALGWSQPGDRFNMTSAWMKKRAAPMLLLFAWRELLRVASDLDDAGVDVRPIVVDWSAKGYKAAARVAYDTMKAETPIDAQPFLPPPPDVPAPKPPASPPIVDPIETPLPEMPLPSVPRAPQGLGLALVLLLVFMITRKKGL